MAWETRDWGSQWVAYPTFDYTSDVGLDVGMGVTRYGFGFRQDPWASRFRAKTLIGVNPDRISGTIEYQTRIDLHGLSIRTTLSGDTRAYTRFFGIGNNTRSGADASYYELYRSHARLDASLLYESPGESWAVWIGPRIERWGELEESPTPDVSEFAPEYGSEEYVQAGMQAGIRIDGRNAVDMPTGGADFRLEGRAFPELIDLRGPYGGLDGTFSLYRGLPGPLDPALHVRLHGERVWGAAPWPDRARLGGRAALPGYPRFRFLGDGAASAAALVRASLLRIGMLGGVRLGGHGIATVGRVWLDGVEDGDLGGHVGLGGGFYARFDALSRSAVISFVKGESGLRTYIGLGFPF
jgi:hypothetical protein